jgi:hypothetical protein
MWMTKWLILCALAAPPDIDTRVVRVSPPGAMSPSEVSVAVDPTDPDHVVIVSLQRREPTTDFAYVTFDGGSSWEQVEGPNPEARTQGDDSVRFGAGGRVLWSHISFRGLRVERPENAANGIFVNRSDDGGLTWDGRALVVDHENTVTPFEDKPYLAIDRARDRVYVAWTRFTKYGSSDPRETSDIYFSVSEDGGESFAMPLRISDAPGDALDSDGTVEGAVPAVGIEGNVYVVWSGPQGFVFDKSLDEGLSFGTDRVIAPHPGGWDIDIEGLGRANGMPVTAVDHSRSEYRGTLYVNWVDSRNGDPDVFTMFSRDGGQSWSEPVRVNDDPMGNGAQQFFTWMAVDPRDGSVNVAFCDRRGLEGTHTGVTLARSMDGGETFENLTVPIEPFETHPAVFFGDYIGIDAEGGRVVVAFPHFVGESELAISAAIFSMR